MKSLLNQPRRHSIGRLLLHGYLVCVLLAFSLRLGAAQAATYYVDSTAGNDANTGLSSAPWASLAKVNAQTFSPGDQVLFKAGDTWSGQLAPHGSGSVNSPILFGSYGGSAKPLIRGQGAVTSAVLISNLHDVILGGFEITNTDGQPYSSTTPYHNGVELVAADIGAVPNIIIENNYIHDVEGPTSGEGASYAGIVVHVTGTSVPTYYTNLILQDNEIANLPTMGGIVTYSNWIQRDGITGYTWWGQTSSNTGVYTPALGMIIRGNYVHDIGEAGISANVVSGTVIEHNVVTQTGFDHNNTDIWWSLAENTVAQFNDVSFANDYDTGDAALDADASSYGSLMQYNFGHNNAIGTAESCGPHGHVIVRYNISQDDTDAPLQIRCNGNAWIDFYNNTVYASLATYSSSHYSKAVPLAGMTGWGGGTMSFTNNVFINPLSKPYYQGSGTSYSNNLYDDGSGGTPDSTAPTDPQALYGNASLQSPGNATGMDSLSGYTPTSRSPAYGSGALIPGNGGRDILGTQIPSTGVSLGAIQAGAVAPAVTSSLATGLGSLSDIVDNDSTTGWSPASGTSGTVTIQYPAAQTFSALSLGVWYGQGQGITNLDIQTWDAPSASWVTRVSGAQLRWGSNSSLVEYRTIDLPVTVTTTLVKLVINNANNQWGHFAINDVHLWNWLPPFTSTTFGGSGISQIADGHLFAGWQSPNSPAFPNNIEMDFRAPRTVSSVSLYTWWGQGQGITNVDVQTTLNGSTWTTQVSNQGITWSSNNNTIETRTIALPSSVTATGVRLVVHSANLQWGHLSVNELTVQ